MRDQLSDTASFAPPTAWFPEQLAQHPRFLDGLNAAVSALLETFRLMPRRVRHVADLQRWILTQAVGALHYQHKTDPAKAPLTAQSLARLLGPARVASKNTITSYLKELERYGFVEPVASADRRQRAVRVTAESEQLAQHYVHIHLNALDAIDGGGRLQAARAQPDFVALAQPRFARRLLALPDWIRPPESIASFVKTDSGSNVLHVLHGRIPTPAALDGGPIWIGPVSPSEIATHTLMSPTHAVRLFAQARQNGLLGWAHASNRGDCWLAPELARDYRAWQALKLSAMSQAARETFEILQGQHRRALA